jgi:hypothetical protein
MFFESVLPWFCHSLKNNKPRPSSAHGVALWVVLISEIIILRDACFKTLVQIFRMMRRGEVVYLVWLITRRSSVRIRSTATNNRQSVAQARRVPHLECGGRRFKSCHSDQLSRTSQVRLRQSMGCRFYILAWSRTSVIFDRQSLPVALNRLSVAGSRRRVTASFGASDLGRPRER